jgi:hypothetical protein
VTPAALLAAAVELRTLRVNKAAAAAVELPPAPVPVRDPAPAVEPAAAATRTAAPAPAPVSSVAEPSASAERLTPAPAPVSRPVVTAPAPVAARSVASPPPPPAGGGLGGLIRRFFGKAESAPVPVPVPVAAVPVPVAVPAPPAPEVAAVAEPVPPVAAPAVPPLDQAAAASAPQPTPDPVPAPVESVPAPVVVEAQEDPPLASAPAHDANGHRHPRPEELVDEARYCGARADVADAAQLADASLRYDPAQHLVGVLKDAYLVSCKWQVPAHLDSPAGRITVDGTTNLIYCEFSAEQLAGLVNQPLDTRPKTRAFSRQEFADLQGMLEQKALVQRLDHVLWQTALETSVGRLPVGMDPVAPIYLKHWPNLTRLHRTPHALRIAALWTTKGAGLLETAQTLKIAQRHVIAFYNAALALDLITEDGAQVRRAQRKTKNNRGLLTRLFGWLNK